MFNPVEDVKAFHEKFKLNYDGPPRMLPLELHEYRFKFMMEELKEYVLGYERLINEDNKAGRADQLDGLVDLMYVLLGTAYMQGFSQFEEAWRRVHEANMRKVRVKRPSDSKRGSGYDVIKPPGWVKPDLTDLV